MKWLGLFRFLPRWDATLSQVTSSGISSSCSTVNWWDDYGLPKNTINMCRQRSSTRSNVKKNVAWSSPRGIIAHLCRQRTSTSLPRFCGATFSLPSYADVLMACHACNPSSPIERLRDVPQGPAAKEDNFLWSLVFGGFSLRKSTIKNIRLG